MADRAWEQLLDLTGEGVRSSGGGGGGVGRARVRGGNAYEDLWNDFVGGVSESAVGRGVKAVAGSPVGRQVGNAINFFDRVNNLYPAFERMKAIASLASAEGRKVSLEELTGPLRELAPDGDWWGGLASEPQWSAMSQELFEMVDPEGVIPSEVRDVIGLGAQFAGGFVDLNPLSEVGNLGRVDDAVGILGPVGLEQIFRKAELARNKGLSTQGVEFVDPLFLALAPANSTYRQHGLRDDVPLSGKPLEELEASFMDPANMRDPALGGIDEELPFGYDEQSFILLNGNHRATLAALNNIPGVPTTVYVSPHGYNVDAIENFVYNVVPTLQNTNNGYFVNTRNPTASSAIMYDTDHLGFFPYMVDPNAPGEVALRNFVRPLISANNRNDVRLNPSDLGVRTVPYSDMAQWAQGDAYRDLAAANWDKQMENDFVNLLNRYSHLEPQPTASGVVMGYPNSLFDERFVVTPAQLRARFGVDSQLLTNPRYAPVLTEITTPNSRAMARTILDYRNPPLSYFDPAFDPTRMTTDTLDEIESARAGVGLTRFIDMLGYNPFLPSVPKNEVQESAKAMNEYLRLLDDLFK